jgi:hypothetical protein
MSQGDLKMNDQMGQKLTKEIERRKFQKVQEQLSFDNFNFIFYWDSTCNGNPSLEAAIAFFDEAEPSRFARLPFEILWKIFTMKQDAEMTHFLKKWQKDWKTCGEKQDSNLVII